MFRVAGQHGDAKDFGIAGDLWFAAGTYELVASPFDGLKGLRVSRETLLRVGRHCELA